MSGTGTSTGRVSMGTSRRRRRWVAILLLGTAVVAVLALAVGALYATSINRSVSQNIHHGITMPEEQPAAEGQAPRPAPRQTSDLNYVLVGSDFRDPDNGLGQTDTLLLVHLNAARNRVHVVGFPRDLYVSVPGHGKDRINTAYAKGGPALAVVTLEKLLGVRMDHVVLVDLAGIVSLTEQIGGVTVDNATAFTSHGYTYRKGAITVAGDEAVWFIRERLALPGGEQARAENRRKVLQAILAKGVSAETIADPRKFSAFMAGLASHLTVDEELSIADIRRIVVSRPITGGDVTSLKAPVSRRGAAPDGRRVDLLDTEKMVALAEALRTDDMDRYLERYPAN